MDRGEPTGSGGDADEVSAQGTNQTGMRERNERLVLTLIRRSPGLAKAEIARRTGLSAQTVSRLIGSLEGEGLILRGQPQRGRVGQPSIPMSLNPSGAFFLGLKVGRRSVEMVLTDFMGAIVDREKQIYGYPDFDEVRAFALAASEKLRAGLPPAYRGRVAGLGIAMPFHLWNWASMIGVSADRMANWQTRDLRGELAGPLGLPIFLQNDATAACSAEMVFAKRPLPANSLCFFVAFFIGGGLMLGNSLYSGSTGNAAGFGPLLVPDLDGGMRPLIDLASLATLEKTLLAEGCDTRQMWLDPEDWAFPDAPMDAWMHRAAHALAYAIRATQTILDLDTVLVDGWLPRRVLADLIGRVRDEVATIDMTGVNRPTVEAGTVGADARALGAVSLPLSARFLID